MTEYSVKQYAAGDLESSSSSSSITSPWIQRALAWACSLLYLRSSSSTPIGPTSVASA